ncbi:hypothetical protein TSAR_006026 [Trichomalopsis sarcophagae]|uniref:NADH dehydrogenase [ubiquinone] 1 beta subcomplex subunit 2, mitochondrial n=1 Tax=Trichomalopsis sarcophagae TaxID=543379 RepID=A0A232EVD3_9HYME|nr:hypothetical protein TSAR_006026 [Trichomalopsis sarcophagae]
MIGSRAVGLLRSISRNPANQKCLTALGQQVRRSSSESDEVRLCCLCEFGFKLQYLNFDRFLNNLRWTYRTGRPGAPWSQRGGLISATICWWWIYWNLYHSWPHLIGMYDGKFLPDPRKDFTDEELGIPPDDV